MKTFAILGLAFGVSMLTVVAQARPVYIEESAALTPPNNGITYAQFGFNAASNGQYALVVGLRSGGGFESYDYDALLYHRTSSGWQYVRILASGGYNANANDTFHPVVIGMKGNLASVELSNSGGTRIFRFNGTDWVPAGTGTHPSEDVSIDGDRLLYGGPYGWDGQVYEPNGSGGWKVTSLPGQPRGYDDEFWGGPVDLLGDRAILGTPYTWDLEPQEIPIYQRYSDGSWQVLAKLQTPAGVWRLGGDVALHGNKAIVDAANGPYVWSNFHGEPDDRLQSANAYAKEGATDTMAKDGNLVGLYAFDADLHRAVINIFRPDAAGKYEHVAVLKASNGQDVSPVFAVQGNTVVTAGAGKAFVFQLPTNLTAFSARYERFESGNGASWTPRAGSQFTVVRPTTLNGVYRQSNTAGDAHSVLNNTSWKNQAIEADIKPNSFRCADCWVGLATRYANDQNYYYVTLRSSGSVQLKRMRNGAFTTLGSTPVTVQAAHTYRLRLESIGTAHRVYLDGVPVLNVEDTTAQASGNAAIVMYGAAADYDNVIVTPTPRATLYADDFTGTGALDDWTRTGPGQWSFANDAFVQSSVAGNARAVTGTPTDDQIVSFRIKPTAFAAGTATQERWVGMLARYTDDKNYYYLTLRNSNKLSLRKLVNDVATEIAAVPVTVTAGSNYSLRLDVAGQSLRVWLNGALVLQAVDSSHPKGRSGVMTYKAAAQIDDYVAYRP